MNSDADREATKQVVQEYDLTWRSFWNGGSTAGPISSAWNVNVWPTVYVIDHEGVIRWKSVRGRKVRTEDLDETIAALVAGAEAAGRE